MASVGEGEEAMASVGEVTLLIVHWRPQDQGCVIGVNVFTQCTQRGRAHTRRRSGYVAEPQGLARDRMSPAGLGHVANPNWFVPRELNFNAVR
eukprot:3566893-Prymnesium_polylepis.3